MKFFWASSSLLNNYNCGHLPQCLNTPPCDDIFFSNNFFDFFPPAINLCFCNWHLDFQLLPLKIQDYNFFPMSFTQLVHLFRFISGTLLLLITLPQDTIFLSNNFLDLFLPAILLHLCNCRLDSQLLLLIIQGYNFIKITHFGCGCVFCPTHVQLGYWLSR